MLATLRRMTKREKEAVRAELDGHIEDHICALMELGYSEELAEERTMLRMGDPAEIGRELNRQYPLGWLVLRWAAAVLALLVLLSLTGPLRLRLGSAADSLRARWRPEREADLAIMQDQNGALVETLWDPDAEIRGEDFHLRVYQAGLKDPAQDTEAWLAVAWWRENPLLPQPENGMLRIYIDGELAEWGSFYLSDCVRCIPVTVEYGDQLEVVMEVYGREYRQTVLLPWEEAEE